MLFERNILPLHFKQWIIQENENRIIVLISILASFLLFFLFDIYYPFPNFLPDSYSYIDAARNNLNINIWPVGYSKFLRFVSVFNYTDTGLFFIQYFLLQGSILFFILTIRYLLNPGYWVIRIITILLVLNPLSLYVSNFVSSDALFATFSLVWLTTLLWLLYKPGKDLILFHGIILFIVFSIRYNSLYYPLITAMVILFKRTPWKIRASAAGLALGPVLIFICYTTLLYKQKTNIYQFTAFGGWQLASNALYMYSNISTKSTSSPPKHLAAFHKLTVKHIDSLQHLKPQLRPDQQLGFYYLWGDGAPLKEYLTERYKNDSTTSYLRRWVSMAPLYGQYGTWLIKQYPMEYIRYFIWPNLINYYAPPTEFLGMYNMGKDSVDAPAVDWFKYKTPKVKVNLKDKIIIVTSVYSILLPMINVLFFFGFIGFILIGGYSRISSLYRNALKILLLVWIANLFFSVTASPIVLRYQIFPLIYTFTFGSILLSYVIRESFSRKSHEKVEISKEIVGVL